MMEPPFQKALGLALRHLRQHDLTSQQVSEKLLKANLEPTTVTQVIEWLSVRGFISERRLTESLLLNSRWTRDKGDALLREKLLQKGVPDAVIDEVLAEVQPAPELERALHVLQAKFRGERSPRRVAGFLERKGFAEETIEQVLDSDFVETPPDQTADTDFQGDF